MNLHQERSSQEKMNEKTGSDGKIGEEKKDD